MKSNILMYFENFGLKSRQYEVYLTKRAPLNGALYFIFIICIKFNAKNFIKTTGRENKTML